MRALSTIFFFFLLTLLLAGTLSAQWEQTSGPNGGQVNCFTVSGTNLFAGTYGGVFLTTNNGMSWTAVNNGLTDTVVFSLAVSGTNLFAGTDSGVFLTTNNGINWTQANSGIPDSIHALASTGTNVFAGSSTRVFLSTDNGTNWTHIFSVPPGDRGGYLVTLAIYGTNLIVGSNRAWGPNPRPYLDGDIDQIADTGTGWNTISNINPPGLGMLRSLGVNGVNIFTSMPLGVYLFNGDMWSEASTGLPNSAMVETWASFGANMFAGIYGLGVFLTTDNGANWISVNSGLDNKSITALVVGDSFLFAGTWPGQVYRRPLSEMIVKVEPSPNKLPMRFELSQNYPNPFNPRTTISYQLPMLGHVTLKVLDVLGREIATLVNGIEEPGYKSVNFNANNFVSGVYYYRLQAGNFIETKKLILLR